MYANQEKNEYHAMVDRVRKRAGGAAEIGGYNAHDINKLRKLDQQLEAAEAKAHAERPAIEAGTRLHQTKQRVHKAWQTVTAAQEVLLKDRRVHEINGARLPISSRRWRCRFGKLGLDRRGDRRRE
jgi:hypothetical protein